MIARHPQSYAYVLLLKTVALPFVSMQMMEQKSHHDGTWEDWMFDVK